MTEEVAEEAERAAEYEADEELEDEADAGAEVHNDAEAVDALSD